MFSKMKIILVTILFFSFNIIISAQESSEKLIEAYESYSAPPREVVFVHLNKSVYVEGEMLGFCAYVFDKFSKKRSLMTSNLYCTISDNEGHVIKEKLVLVENGVASNVFNIDSTLTKTTYSFKAFTNYMMNFDEQNHFEQKFNIICANKENEINDEIENNQIDLQFLPEGGHLVSDVYNTVAIIAKDSRGFGIPNANVQLFDYQNNIISETKLNEFGIGKTIFKPLIDSSCYLKINYNGLSHQLEINDIKVTGLALTLNEIQDKVVLNFRTNKKGLNHFGKKNFRLVIHNGNELKMLPVKLNNQLEVNVALNYSSLFPGINIFTLFDDYDNPILERLFFNYQGVLMGDDLAVKVIKKPDSILVRLKMNDLVTDSFNSISVSILPPNTISYKHHNNIFSSLYLQPYVKGVIENGDYYFREVDRKTKYNMDLLLQSQGWSNYNWKNIFKGTPLLSNTFDRGIDLVASVNDKNKQGVYIVYPLQNSNTEIFDLKPDQSEFYQKNLVPIEGESFKSSLLKKRGKTDSPKLYLRFHPSFIPKYTKSTNILSTNFIEHNNLGSFNIASNSWENAIILDEVVIQGINRSSRYEKLNKRAVNSRINVVDETDRSTNIRLSDYLNRLGWLVQELPESYTIRNPRIRRGANIPLVYLDNALLTDLNVLSNTNMTIIDAVESDFIGSGGGGLRGSAGFIKIYTDPTILNNGNDNSTGVFRQPFPLTFAKEKKYYTPVYKFYNTRFFNEFGVMGWFTNLKPDANNFIEFQIPNTGSSGINLYIEGVTNNNQLISSKKSISLN